MAGELSMKVLIHTHWCYPYRKAGSERYTHHVAKYLVSQGHEVWYLCWPDIGEAAGQVDFFQDGCRVIVERPGLDILAHYDWADVVWSHLSNTRICIDNVQKVRRPLVNVLHNGGALAHYKVKPKEVDLLVYNSEWLKNKTEPRFTPKQSHVLIPPFSVAEFECSDEDKKFITHINCNEGKGVMFSRHYAKDLPQYEFLFQMGHYFTQLCPRGTHRELMKFQVDLKEIDFPENCVYNPLTTNMTEEVYSRTKVLVCPSAIDTWGMVCLEAMASGIPVICHPDHGFLESCGKAGIFIDRKKAHVMKAMLVKLMEDKGFYKQQSDKSRARALEVEALAQAQLEQLEQKLQELRV